MVYFMENPIKMDDLGVPLFLETPIYTHPKNNEHETWKKAFFGKGNASTQTTIFGGLYDSFQGVY